MASVILFDGVCNLCNGFVNFIVRRDKKHRFMFATLNSNYAKEVDEKYGINLADLNTVILIKQGKVYTKSKAVLCIAKGLGFPFSLIYGFIVIPPFIRNYIYNFVANNRYGWFGKRQNCMVPSPKDIRRFIQ